VHHRPAADRSFRLWRACHSIAVTSSNALRRACVRNRAGIQPASSLGRLAKVNVEETVAVRCHKLPRFFVSLRPVRFLRRPAGRRESVNGFCGSTPPLRRKLHRPIPSPVRRMLAKIGAGRCDWVIDNSTVSGSIPGGGNTVAQW
jgi:hypothetical protein